MVLAGVIMKLGAYGCLRVAMGLFPHGMDPWGFSFAGIGSWRDVFAVLAVIGIVYGALVALVQSDFKFVIGYSSVSHMGFVLLGLMTLNQIGMTGAVLQMFSHGILAGLLFAIVGRVVYDRTHTRQLASSNACTCRSGFRSRRRRSSIAGMASMGLPGFLRICCGTAGPRRLMESQSVVDRGGRRRHCVGVAYTWRALQKAFFTDIRPTAEDHPRAAGTIWRPLPGRKSRGILPCSLWPACGWGFIRGSCSMRFNRQWRPC